MELSRGMLSDFLININRLGGNGEGIRTLLTVSGGVDSVVMSDLYGRAGLLCGIAHCNFKLRGGESDKDAALVRELADRLGFQYHEIAFDTLQMASEWKMSTQMAARKLRYDWFAEVLSQFDYRYIATAHHAGDQIETVLLNLVRGTGIKGLRGIPSANGRIIRPMLFASRERILDYAKRRELSWREDQSNSDDYYRRNRIRKHVVPVLKSINPSLENTVSEMTSRMEAASLLLENTLALWKAEVWSEERSVIRISIDGIRKAVSPEYQVFAILEEYGFSWQQVREIVKALEGIPGKEFFSSTHRLLKDRDNLILTRQKGKESHSEVVYAEVFSRADDFEFGSDPTVGFFDADLLKTPLKRRSWQYGDIFRPLGMGGKRKKVSDLLVDLKLDKVTKDNVKVITDREENIIWVEGIRTDHTVRVTAGTKNIARINALKR